MPHAAIETGAVEYVLPLDQIGPTLTALARTSDE
jgi:chemotaxis response regulator CheB